MSVTEKPPEQENDPATRSKRLADAPQNALKSRGFSLTVKGSGGDFEVNEGTLYWFADDEDAPPYCWGIPGKKAIVVLETLLEALRMQA